MANKHNINDWDIFLQVEPQYLVEFGIKRIHEKTFKEAIRKRHLYKTEKKEQTMDRPCLTNIDDPKTRWIHVAVQAKEVIDELPGINHHLNTDLVKCEDMVDLMLLALFSNEHLLLLGPPGTAKTTVANRVSSLIVGGNFFYNLMTRFTTPD